MMSKELSNYLAGALLTVLGSLVIGLAIGPYVEQRFFPIIEPFVVEEVVYPEKEVLEVTGWMIKLRGYCTPVELSSVVVLPDGVMRVSPVKMMDREKDELISRPEGRSLWGPWRVVVPLGSKSAEVRVRHRCHPFWETSQSLTVLPLEQ